MGYIQDIEAELRIALNEMLKSDDPTTQENWRDNIIQWAKDKIYQSYKNGLAAAKQGKSAKKWKSAKGEKSA